MRFFHLPQPFVHQFDARPVLFPVSQFRAHFLVGAAQFRHRGVVQVNQGREFLHRRGLDDDVRLVHAVRDGVHVADQRFLVHLADSLVAGQRVVVAGNGGPEEFAHVNEIVVPQLENGGGVLVFQQRTRQSAVLVESLFEYLLPQL